MTRRKLFEWGGVAASIMLILIGAGSIIVGAWGINTVRDNLARENIVGTDDSSIPGQKVDTGSEARAFADVMRQHALEASDGQTYAEMGRFLDENGNQTSDEAAAAKDPETGQPVENQARNIWVTQTAFATALNVAYLGERIGVFGMIMGVALVLIGIGFLVLTLSGALREREPAAAHAAATG
jgi:hypothetical protein